MRFNLTRENPKLFKKAFKVIFSPRMKDIDTIKFQSKTLEYLSDRISTNFVLFYFLEKIQQLTRDNYRTRDLDEELLIAKEVSVRLHSELEKSEESRMITEKLNMSLKQHLDTLKESLDQKLSIV